MLIRASIFVLNEVTLTSTVDVMQDNEAVVASVATRLSDSEKELAVEQQGEGTAKAEVDKAKADAKQVVLLDGRRVCCVR